ncbi:MAG TPA: tripartite tricarboxylate transporter substrate-binding protein [Burkholderiales bacterium]|nr:tripartite tricarboxylate transporter substrate-binding protein [Burkholderiales bacterium]
MWKVVIRGLVLLFGLVLVAMPPAFAQQYPNKVVKIVIPFAPGGSADTVLRPLAEKLGAALGQAVVVDTRAGGLTVIGAEYVAKSPPDGYTLYLMAGTHVLLPYLLQNVPFDPIKDFIPIAMLGAQPYLFVAHPGQPFNSTSEMIRYAKANPGKLSIGVSDIVTRVAAESFLSAAQVDMSVVPYKGGGPVTTDVLGGHLSVGIASPLLLSYVKEGRLKALGISSAKRISSAPALPTIEEAAGIPGYEMQTWYAIAGPAGIPPNIVARLRRDIERILAEPDMRQRLAEVGWEPAGSMTTEQAQQLMTDYMQKMGKLIRAAGIKPE